MSRFSQLCLLLCCLCLGSALATAQEEGGLIVELGDDPSAIDLPSVFDTSDTLPQVPSGFASGSLAGNNVAGFRAERFEAPATSMRNDFTSFPDFDGGLTISGGGAAMKVGGYVKADLISDFDAINSTDTFNTGAIAIGEPDRRNARFHARQSRLSFDSRWRVEQDVARAFVEIDFFGQRSGSSDTLRLRHAYGAFGNLTVGQTWTTFTDPSAVPQTLDTEGAVSNVNRRQGLLRWQSPLWSDRVSLALAVEDPRITIEVPEQVDGELRTETPDFVTRLRLEEDWCEFQIAMVLRELGFQPTGQAVLNELAWGFNFTGSVLFQPESKVYYQITFGEGIGSYRGSPDVVATGPTTAEILPVFGWMIGLKHSWSDRLTSNVTFSELNLDDVPGQSPDNLRNTSYFAINLIQNPYERVFWGVEYLYGVRTNQSLLSADARRLQMSFGFFLP
ncbi:MAG: DcaP family trimeric outer membrane transporter [Aureliella sp.]